MTFLIPKYSIKQVYSQAFFDFYPARLLNFFYASSIVLLAKNVYRELS